MGHNELLTARVYLQNPMFRKGSDKRDMRVDINNKRVLTAFIMLLLFCAPSASSAADGGGTRHDLQTMVEVAAAGLGGILAHLETREEKIALIQSFIEPVRVFPDQSGYFFVYDSSGTCVAHAVQNNLIGKNLYNRQDIYGRYPIRELLNRVRLGGGYVEYSWERPNFEGEYEKIGYVKKIPGTDFFIGSGIYFPHVPD